MQKDDGIQNNIYKYSSELFFPILPLSFSQKRDVGAKELSSTKSWEKSDSHCLQGAVKVHDGAVYLVIFPS